MKHPSFLVIRRDNIGDLVCTLPMLTALRERYPGGVIAALVTTYNKDVLDNNPSVDEVFAYEKAKHRPHGQSLLRNYIDRWRLFFALRRRQFDYAILAGPRYQKHSAWLAQMAGVAQVVGFSDSGQSRGVNIRVPYGRGEVLHEVEDSFRLLAPFGILGSPPLAGVVPSKGALDAARKAVDRMSGAGPLVAVHISARKPSQRWSASRFSELGRALSRRYGCRLILLWSPGDGSNPRHPGDDEKAGSIAAGLSAPDYVRYPTRTLSELIGALGICDLFIGPDGGAMHLAAGLGKPVVALFGDSAPSRWRPWKVASEVIQAPTRHVSDVSVEQVLRAYEGLSEARRSYVSDA